MGFEYKATAENVNEQDGQGNTRLHEAMNFKSLEEIRNLMDLGADPNIANNEGITAQAVASETFLNVMNNMEEARKEIDEFDKKLDKLYEKPKLDKKEKETKEFYQAEKAGRLAAMAVKKEVLLRWRNISSLVTPKSDDEIVSSVDKDMAKMEERAKAKMAERRENAGPTKEDDAWIAEAVATIEERVKAEIAEQGRSSTLEEISAGLDSLQDRVTKQGEAISAHRDNLAEAGRKAAQIEASMKELIEVRKQRLESVRRPVTTAVKAGDQHVQSADGNTKATPGVPSPKSVSSKELF
jgi:hypothetical protein